MILLCDLCADGCPCCTDIQEQKDGSLLCANHRQIKEHVPYQCEATASMGYNTGVIVRCEAKSRRHHRHDTVRHFNTTKGYEWFNDDTQALSVDW